MTRQELNDYSIEAIRKVIEKRSARGATMSQIKAYLHSILPNWTGNAAVTQWIEGFLQRMEGPVCRFCRNPHMKQVDQLGQHYYCSECKGHLFNDIWVSYASWLDYIENAPDKTSVVAWVTRNQPIKLSGRMREIPIDPERLG